MSDHELNTIKINFFMDQNIKTKVKNRYQNYEKHFQEVFKKELRDDDDGASITVDLTGWPGSKSCCGKTYCIETVVKLPKKIKVYENYGAIMAAIQAVVKELKTATQDPKDVYTKEPHYKEPPYEESRRVACDSEFFVRMEEVSVEEVSMKELIF